MRPLVVSYTVNRRVGLAISSSSSSDGNPTLASTRVRDPSCGRRAGSRVGTAIVVGPIAGRVGVAGFGAAGPFGGGPKSLSALSLSSDRSLPCDEQEMLARRND